MTFDPVFENMYHSKNQHNKNHLIERVFLYQNPLRNRWALPDHMVSRIGLKIGVHSLLIRTYKHSHFYQNQKTWGNKVCWSDMEWPILKVKQRNKEHKLDLKNIIYVGMWLMQQRLVVCKYNIQMSTFICWLFVLQISELQNDVLHVHTILNISLIFIFLG